MMLNMSDLSPLNVSLSPQGNSSDDNNFHEDFGLTPQAIAICVILGIFCILGTVGNALAFFIYYRKREKGTSTIFILCLAVTDFFTCLVAIPYTIAHELVVYRLAYDIVCKLYMFIQTFNIPLSSLIMVAIGLDRYLCICHPFLHAMTVPRAKACVIVLTIVSALLGIVPCLSHGVYETMLQEVPYNVTVSQEDSFSAVSSPEPTASAAPGVNAEEAASGATTPMNGPSTSLFTNGLYLSPAAEFINDLEEQKTGVNYRNGDPRSSPYSTARPNLATVAATMNTSSVMVNASVGIPLSYITMMRNETVIIYRGHCMQNTVYLSTVFVGMYLKVYAGLYLVEFFILAILYALIYRSILVRRAWKSKRKRMSCYASTNCQETVAEETQLTNINGGGTETVLLKKNPGRISAAMRDRTLYANIKTAAMLFVVTIGFIVSFLPSWLMGLRILPFNMIVFYMFYINNVINPIIYAFMNRAFRDDLFQLLRSCFRH